MDRFLTQLTDPQLAFSIRQKRPENIDDAVTATLEMQAHLSLAKRATTGGDGGVQPHVNPADYASNVKCMCTICIIVFLFLHLLSAES